MTTAINVWATWALRVLTRHAAERRPMPRVRLGCELMEGRLVPATVVYTGTETWTALGGDLTVTSTVTKDVSGHPNKYLWECHVTNTSYSWGYTAYDGFGQFAVPVYDTAAVEDINSPAQWLGSAADGQVKWAVGLYEPGLALGNHIDFSFTTPDTAPMSTDATGTGMDAGSGETPSGLCAAPVVGVPSVKFTNGPKEGSDPGDVKFDCRWDNIPAAGVKIIVNVRSYYNKSILYASEVIELHGKASGDAKGVVVKCGAIYADKRVVVSLTVVADNNIPIFPGVSEQKEGRTK